MRSCRAFDVFAGEILMRAEVQNQNKALASALTTVNTLAADKKILSAKGPSYIFTLLGEDSSAFRSLDYK